MSLPHQNKKELLKISTILIILPKKQATILFFSVLYNKQSRTIAYEKF